MTGNDLISVIIPVYNAEKYVRQTMDSIINQTYKNLEILLIDDGSKDASASICEEYLSDDRVQVFRRENAGVAASRQFGIEACKGEYFVTVDSDDYVALDYVEKLYEAVTSNNADIAVCGVNCFADGKNDMRCAYMPSSGCKELPAAPKENAGTARKLLASSNYKKLAVSRELLESDYYGVSCEALLTDSWNKIYRTQFVRESGVKFELNKIYNGPDLQFNHKLALHCPVYAFCHEALLFHRVTPGSRVRRKDKPLQEGLEIITDTLIDECERVGLIERCTREVQKNAGTTGAACEITGSAMCEQLTKVYYDFVGIVVYDIFCYGGGTSEKHAKFKKLIARNKAFLRSHSGATCCSTAKRSEAKGARGGEAILRGGVIKKRGAFEKFKAYKTVLPCFVLDSALALDAAFLYYRCKRKLNRMKK